MDRRAAFLAFGLHAAVLSAWLPACTTNPPPPPPRAAAQRPQLPAFVRIVPDGNLACEKAYVGYGVMTSVMGRVSDVAPGSPAERAFIREGDYIENADEFAPDTLPIGTPITLQVRRDGVTMAKTLRVARVCYR